MVWLGRVQNHRQTNKYSNVHTASAATSIRTAPRSMRHADTTRYPGRSRRRYKTAAGVRFRNHVRANRHPSLKPAAAAGTARLSAKESTHEQLPRLFTTHAAFKARAGVFT
eukprot:353138-Chlamydomonas_euryale.AAC.1